MAVTLTGGVKSYIWIFNYVGCGIPSYNTVQGSATIGKNREETKVRKSLARLLGRLQALLLLSPGRTLASPRKFILNTSAQGRTPDKLNKYNISICETWCHM